MSKKKTTDYQELWLDHGIDVPGRHIFLAGTVDEAMTDRLISGLHLMDGDSEVTITISSYGGSVDEMFAMYDTIKGFHAHITMKVKGYACSAACIMLQAADKRIVAPNAFIMHHVGEAGFGSLHPKNLEHAHNLYKKQLAAMENILLSRIRQKKPDITATTFRNRHEWDIYLSAREAVEWGLADEVGL